MDGKQWIMAKIPWLKWCGFYWYIGEKLYFIFSNSVLKKKTFVTYWKLSLVMLLIKCSGKIQVVTPSSSSQNNSKFRSLFIREKNRMKNADCNTEIASEDTLHARSERVYQPWFCLILSCSVSVPSQFCLTFVSVPFTNFQIFDEFPFKTVSALSQFHLQQIIVRNS